MNQGLYQIATIQRLLPLHNERVDVTRSGERLWMFDLKEEHVFVSLSADAETGDILQRVTHRANSPSEREFMMIVIGRLELEREVVETEEPNDRIAREEAESDDARG